MISALTAILLEVNPRPLKHCFLTYKIVLNYKTIHIFGKTNIQNSTEEYKIKTCMFHSPTISYSITRGNFFLIICFYFLCWLLLNKMFITLRLYHFQIASSNFPTVKIKNLNQLYLSPLSSSHILLFLVMSNNFNFSIFIFSMFLIFQ